LDQAFHFPQCPGPKLIPARIVSPPKLFAFAAEQAFRPQAIVPAAQLAQFQPERPVVIRTPYGTALPKMLDHLMRLFC